VVSGLVLGKGCCSVGCLITSPISPLLGSSAAVLRREERGGQMGGSGKWVKLLIGLKKPEKEDCKVSATGCSWFLEREKTSTPFFHCFGVFSLLIYVIMMEIFGLRVFFFFGAIFPGQI
jgi:hypothetical protein